MLGVVGTAAARAAPVQTRGSRARIRSAFRPKSVRRLIESIIGALSLTVPSTLFSSPQPEERRPRLASVVRRRSPARAKWHPRGGHVRHEMADIEPDGPTQRASRSTRAPCEQLQVRRVPWPNDSPTRSDACSPPLPACGGPEICGSTPRGRLLWRGRWPRNARAARAGRGTRRAHPAESIGHALGLRPSPRGSTLADGALRQRASRARSGRNDTHVPGTCV
jgi:hypothetical protein